MQKSGQQYSKASSPSYSTSIPLGDLIVVRLSTTGASAVYISTACKWSQHYLPHTIPLLAFFADSALSTQRTMISAVCVSLALLASLPTPKPGTGTTSTLARSNVLSLGDTVTLSSGASPVLSVEIRASYETDRMLGSGDVIGKLQMSWDEVLNHRDELFDISFPPVYGVHSSLTLKAGVPAILTMQQLSPTSRGHALKATSGIIYKTSIPPFPSSVTPLHCVRSAIPIPNSIVCCYLYRYFSLAAWTLKVRIFNPNPIMIADQLAPSRLPRPSTSTSSLMPLPVKRGCSATIGHSRPALSKPIANLSKGKKAMLPPSGPHRVTRSGSMKEKRPKSLDESDAPPKASIINTSLSTNDGPATVTSSSSQASTFKVSRKIHSSLRVAEFTFNECTPSHSRLFNTYTVSPPSMDAAAAKTSTPLVSVGSATLHAKLPRTPTRWE
ncbi:hypothetical protein CY34DRAFT_18117 [Suillus luteus UH-Slu-Lm8-n1]|uniref:Uncharacterized protein n=1 Tax=Suillus luteus UH-Slu-Lm8-n1 TaxID=930992 RepID=A0A0D0AHT4_9AGAM|nr:hypothetical protein CY34DRAFT_18117 [Suillus luteus UH-Slu-Lm8-n1]